MKSSDNSHEDRASLNSSADSKENAANQTTRSIAVPKRYLKAATQQVLAWFQQLNRQPFAFQRQTWQSYLSGRHGLIYAQTGTGKTLAAFLGPVIEQLAVDLHSMTTGRKPISPAASNRRRRRRRKNLNRRGDRCRNREPIKTHRVCRFCGSHPFEPWQAIQKRTSGRRWKHSTSTGQ